MGFNSPILYIVYNRPDLTIHSFKRISELRPKVLFVSCDGFNPEKPDDANRVQAVRQIVKDIDWPCEVQYKFFDKNQGCKVAVSTAIDWFFSHVDRGIIIEDDIIPSGSFFEFAEAMLKKYQDEESIMHISGNSFSPRSFPNGESYYFSSIPHIWGWATWKRAWSRYSVEMRSYSEDMNFQHIPSSTIKDYFHKHFLKCKKNEINTWDCQWGFTIWKNQGLCITPAVNLIQNIGFGPEATHTTANNPRLEKMTGGDLKKPYVPPWQMKINHAMDEEMFRTHFLADSVKPNILRRMIRRLMQRS